MAGERPLRAVAVGAGCSHSVALLSDSRVLSWGKGEDGQLGHGDAREHLTPCIIQALDDKEIDDVICGADFTVALSRATNTVYSWGWGDFGRLGHGDSSDQALPWPVRGLSSVAIAVIACGDNHTLAATTDGSLYAFGRNQNGQLGLGNENDSLVPQPVTALSGKAVVSIACGAEHSVASTADHEVFAWGWGRYGNLGLGDCKDRNVPHRVLGLDGVKIASVACGWRHSSAVSEEGDMYTFGWSKYGQLGHGDFDDHTVPKLVESLRGRIKEVSGGWRHTAALTKEGELFCWGWGKFGQVGVGDREDKNSPQRVSGGDMGETRVEAVRCGWRHTLCITEEGHVFAWGRGANGQLGVKSTLDKLVPTEIVTLTPGKLDPAVLVAPKEDGEATGDAAVPDISAPVPENEVPNTKRQKLT